MRGEEGGQGVLEDDGLFVCQTRHEDDIVSGAFQGRDQYLCGRMAEMLCGTACQPVIGLPHTGGAKAPIQEDFGEHLQPLHQELPAVAVQLPKT